MHVHSYTRTLANVNKNYLQTTAGQFVAQLAVYFFTTYRIKYHTRDTRRVHFKAPQLPPGFLKVSAKMF